jgi:hypothetical protein
VTGKSEAIATVKEMPVIPVNKVLVKRRIIGKRGLRRRTCTRGSLTLQKSKAVFLK